MRVSIVVPVFNEEQNVEPLYHELRETMSVLNDLEILFVDDGSTDGTASTIRRLTSSDSRVRCIRFRTNYGQTAAMQAGIERCWGDVIVTIDGDLQNDPADIVPMINKLQEGFDLVHGWRRRRQDAWLSRKLPSRIANWLISRITNFPVHDLGCTLKVMRREIAEELELYGQMHRFIPILASQRGARCAEMVTNHRARKFGKSKYGIARTLQVLLDLMTVKYMQNYFANPMKLFGRLGFASTAIGSLSFTATVMMKLAGGFDMTGNPLLLLGVFFILAGIQLCGMGLLAEVCARIYYNGNQHRPFSICYDSDEDVAITHRKERSSNANERFKAA